MLFNRVVYPPFWINWWFIVPLVLLIGFGVVLWINKLKRRVRDEEILNYFATSLYGQNTVDDIFWDISRNCISKLHYTDCVLYKFDPQRKILVQSAAFGPKNPVKNEILNPIEIPFGHGIVGSVAATRKGEIVRNTARDKRYIVDDERRYSEITVPIMVEGDLFGIIDSEHSSRNFYGKTDLKLLTKIAEICGAKISKFLVQEKLRESIARDLHDEMGSTLTSIHIISQLALQDANGNPQVTGHLQKIRDHVGRMMESISDIVWVINPYNDTMDKIIIRMKEFASEIFDPPQINYQFNSSKFLEEIRLNPEQRKDLYLIFKEALNNIVKYSRANQVVIDLGQDEQVLYLRITDNGSGFDPEHARRGNGLLNMKARAEHIEGTLVINSVVGEGTIVELQVPFQNNSQTEEKPADGSEALI